MVNLIEGEIGLVDGLVCICVPPKPGKKVKNGDTGEWALETEGDSELKTLIDCDVRPIAYDPVKELLLFRFKPVKGDMSYKTERWRVAANPNILKMFLAPYSLTANPKELNALMLWWRENMKEKEDLLVSFNSYGKFSDRETGTALFVLKDFIVVYKEGGEPTRRVVPYQGTHVMRLSDRKWLMVDITNAGVPSAPEVPRGITTARELEELMADNIGPVKRDMFIMDWMTQFGDEVLLAALLGWFIALMNLDEVMRIRGRTSFPFFFLSGLTRAGKSSLLENAMKFWGFREGGALNFSATMFTNVKQISGLSRIPLWRDEFRNNQAREREGFLRSTYTLSPNIRGTATQSLNVYPTNTSLLLSGEDTISDPATRRRFIVFDLNHHLTISEDAFKTACKLGDKVFARGFYAVLQTPFDEAVFEKLIQETLYTTNNSDEEVVAYAALGAVFGEDVGRSYISLASDYWKAKRRAEGELEGTQREGDIVTAAFEILDTIFLKAGWWESRVAYNGWQNARVFSYFHWDDIERELYIHSASVFREVVQSPHYKDEYNLSAPALRRQVQDRFNAQNVVVNFLDGRRRALVIKEKAVDADPTLRNIKERLVRELERRAAYEQHREENFEEVFGRNEREKEEKLKVAEVSMGIA